MALVDINGRSVVVPDDMAQHFDPSSALVGSVFDMPKTLIPPAPQMPEPPKPDPYPFDPAEVAYHTGRAPVFDSDQGTLVNPATGMPSGVPKSQPRTDAARIGIQGFGDGQEYAGPPDTSIPSVTGGAMPTQDAQNVAGAPAAPREYVAGKFDNSDQAIAKSNKAYGKQQAQAAQQQAAQAAYAASPEGRMGAADQAQMDALGSQAEAMHDGAQVDANIAREKYNAMLGAQQEADRIAQEQARVAAEREKVRQQKTAEVERFTKDVDNFKVSDPGIWGGHSTANNVGRIIAMAMTGLGMALMGRGHEQNPVISMFDAEARRSVQMQMDKRAQLEKRADRAQSGLDSFDRISDSTDAKYNAKMARAYEYGIRMGDLSVAKYGDQKAEANWKANRAELEKQQAEYMAKSAGSAWDREMQKQQMAAQRSQVAQGWSRIKLDRDQFTEGKRQFDKRQELEQAQLLLEADKQSKAGNAVGSKAVLEQGVAAPPTMTVDADGNVVVDRNTGVLQNADGQPWLIPTKEEAIKFRSGKGATDELIDIIDEIRQIRERTGGESSWGNSNDYQRLKVLEKRAAIIAKSGTEGLSSENDMKIVTGAAGVDDVASFRAQAAKLDEARDRIVKSVNTKARSLGYTGRDISYADPLKLPKPMQSAQQRAAADAMAFDPNRSIKNADTIAMDAGTLTPEAERFAPQLAKTVAAAQGIAMQGGVPAYIRDTVSSLIATANGDKVPKRAREQAQALLLELAKNAENEAVRNYASQALTLGNFTGPTDRARAQAESK